MTRPEPQPRGTGDAVVGARARSLLRTLAGRTGGDALLVSAGSVVDHVVRPGAGDSLVEAVLCKSVEPLLRIVSRRRTSAVLPAGAALTLSVPHQDWLVAPLAGPGPLEVWLSPSHPLELSVLHPLLEELAAAVSGQDDGPGLVEVLEGRASLPPDLLDRSLAVAAVRTKAPSTALHRLTARLEQRGARHLAAARGDVVHLVADVRQSDLLALVAELPARGVVAELSATGGLARLLPALAAALDVLADGESLLLDGLAGRVAVHRAARAVLEAPVARDPLHRLLEHDALRGGDLAASLLVWLDAQGDTSTTADRLCLHRNTVRYRVRQGRLLLDADLEDPSDRLDVHLRLHALREAGRL